MSSVPLASFVRVGDVDSATVEALARFGEPMVSVPGPGEFRAFVRESSGRRFGRPSATAQEAAASLLRKLEANGAR